MKLRGVIPGEVTVGCKPTSLKGRLTDLNQRSIVEVQPYSTETLLLRLESAHLVTQQTIHHPGLELIPYRQGSRMYTPEEHLEIVDHHITGHLKEVEKSLSASG